jgi:TRAP-type C4-dicarboxylate transport system permease small subunit
MSAQPIIALIIRLQRAQLRLAAVALVVMMLVTVADVFLRYFFNRPIPSSYDIVESTLVVVIFHGLSAVFLSRQNITIDLIDSVVGRSTVTFLTKIADFLSLLAIGLFGYAMITPAMQAFGYGDRKPELGLPIYVLWIFAIAGIVGAMLGVLALMLGHVAPARTEAPE